MVIPKSGAEITTGQIVFPSAPPAGTVLVTLDVSTDEYHGGEQVKRATVRYPLKVVRQDVDPQRNPFGLALDCYAGAPQRIEAPPLEQSPAATPSGGTGFPRGGNP